MTAKTIPSQPVTVMLQQVLQQAAHHHQAGRSAEAEACYRQALKLEPNNAQVYNNLGSLLKGRNLYSEAEVCYRQALVINPDYPAAHFNLGNVLRDQGRLPEAEACYRQALALKPDLAEAHNNLGAILKGQGLFSETCYRQALAINPDYAAAHYNLGVALQEQGCLSEAEVCYRRALGIEKNYAEAYSNLGTLLREKNLYFDAEICFRRALEIKPDYAAAHSNLGNNLRDQGRLVEAEASYRLALKIKSDYAEAHSNLLFLLSETASHTPSCYLAEARQYGRMVAKKVETRFCDWLCSPNPKRLRVGVVSGDLRNHPVGYFLENLLTHLDSSTIELIAYPTKHYSDELTERIKPSFSAWKSLFGLSDESAARLIRADGVHLLLDISGHTAHNRLPLFAWKPAPVQVSWLGYFATTGVAEMDFLLADRVGVTEGMRRNFTESVWYLPDTRFCFTPPEIVMPVTLLPAVNNGYVTFGCYQNLAKVGDAVLAAWGRILAALPDARLRLQCKQLGDSLVMEALIQRLQRYSIDPARVVMHGFTSRKAYLASHVEVDLILDTFPYPGGTTTCEAMWMGVPTLTLSGDSLMARQGASLLTAAGLGDWVADSTADYVGKAIAFASDIPRLASLRASLREKVLGSALFDGSRFARNFEEALWGMWQARTTLEQSKQQGLQSVAAEALVEQLRCPSPEELDTLLAQHKQGHYVEGEILARKLTARFPSHGFCWKVLGVFLKEQGRIEEAITPMQKAASLLPGDADAHSNLGVVLRILGRLEEAEASYHQALRINPDRADVHSNLAVCLTDQARFVEAIASCYEALRLGPDSAGAHINLGNALKALGRLNEATASYRQALKIRPDLAEVHSYLGATLEGLGRLDEAVVSYRRVLEIKPNDAKAHSALGYVFWVLGRHMESEASFRRAMELKPDDVIAHCNLGVLQAELGKLDDAVKSYRRALEISPDYPIAYNNLGSCLRELGQVDDAVMSFRRTLEIKPDYIEAHSNLLFSYNLLASLSSAEMLEEALHYGELVAQQADFYNTWSNDPNPSRCLRIGLVSGDLRNHAVGYFIEAVLAEFNRITMKGMEFYAYATLSRADGLTERIKAYCQGWYSAMGKSDESLAQQIRDDSIDILIDLSGHTRHNRLPLFAWKPAPVQVSWLGYFATTGVAAIDYLIADPWVLPETEEIYFTEKIWRLPETRLCFTPPKVDIEVAPLPALTNGHITFGCFNNLAKMNDDVVALWARVLASVPGSCLFLKAKQLNEASVRQNTIKRFAAHCIDADRLILEGFESRAKYLAAYHQVDIALDPFPYTGGTTSVEGLWMGVPVLTLAGEHFLSRQGVGILMNAGLPDWIATDADDYVAHAMRHARELQDLAALRNGLRQQLLASPIFDAPRFARHFETALRGMWRVWCAGQSKL